VLTHACGLFHCGDEDMGARIDPLPSLGVPLLRNATEAVFELRVGEQPITGAFSLAQLLADLVQVYSGVPTDRARVQLAKPRLLAESENDVNGWQTRRLHVSDLGKKRKGTQACRVTSGATVLTSTRPPGPNTRYTSWRACCRWVI